MARGFRARVPRFEGLGSIAAAALVAGLLGYAITTLAARGLGAHQYADFSAFWGAQYLAVGTLAGLQQEFARATTSREEPAHDFRRVLLFAAGASIAAAAVATVILLFLGQHAFDDLAVALSIPLVVGIAFNAALAVLTGVVYGTSSWRVLSTIFILDPVLRLGGILLAIQLGYGVPGAVWASVLPYPVVLLLLLATFAPPARRRVAVDVSTPRLVANSLRTIGASLGVATLVSGLPLLIGLARGEANDAEVGVLIFVLILTRAPLVLAVLSFQSYLIVVLRTRSPLIIPALMGAVIAGGGLFALAGWLWGSPVIVLIAGEQFHVEGGLIALLVLSSIGTALLGVTGAAVLARSLHGLYIGGWTAAALACVLLLFFAPGDLEGRVVLSLIGGPLIGLAIHAVGFVRSRVTP